MKKLFFLSVFMLICSTIFAQAVRTPVFSAKTKSTTIDFPSTAADTSSDVKVFVNGARSGDFVLVGTPDSVVNTKSNFSGWVYKSDTVKVRFNNYSTGAINPISGIFKILVIRQ